MKKPTTTENHKITVKMEEITPQLAQEYLKLNYEHNRKIAPRRVEFIADMIRRGQWIVNGATLCFTESGVLIDGQNRLAAIVSSGKTVESLVARNVNDKAFLTIDTGRTRSNADILHISGEVSSVVLACSARFLNAWEKNQSFGSRFRERISAADLQTILKRHPGLRDSIRETQHYGLLIKRIGPSFISAFFYILSQIDHDEAKAFYDHLFLGTDLSKGHPILHLRNQLLAQAQIPGAGLRFDPTAMGRLWVKAWNHFAAGDRIDRLIVKEADVLDKVATPKGSYKVRYQIT